jgi:hypothetical protein
MELRKVDPRSIAEPEVRVTAQFDEELYEEFKKSLKEVGPIAPPIVYEVEGQLVLCDGLHRLQEAITNGMTEIDVVVIPGDMIDVLTKNIFLDHLRGKTPVSQMVKVIGALYQEYHLDPDKIKERTGLTRRYIEDLIKISEASPELLVQLDAGVIGVGHAREIARLPMRIQQEEILAKQQIWRYPVAELKGLIDETLHLMQVAPTGSSAATQAAVKKPLEWRCEGCKEIVEPRYLKPVMLCPDCFGVLWKLARAKEQPEVKKTE